MTRPCTPRCLDDLRAHRAFAGLRGSLRESGQPTVTLEFSGHPRLTADGRFAGYWGVARDISEQVRAEASVAALGVDAVDAVRRHARLPGAQPNWPAAAS